MTRIESGDSGQGSGRSVLIHEFVTGGGMAETSPPRSLADEGRAMRLALAEEFAAVPGLKVVMTLDSRAIDEPGPWQVVRIGPGQEQETFARLAASVDFTLTVAPETEGILFHRARILEQVGTRSLGCSSEGIALAGNVVQTLHRLQALGISTPPTLTVRPRADWPDPLASPLAELQRIAPPRITPPPDPAGRPRPLAVLKPIDGAGATHSFLLDREADWPNPSWIPEVAVLQPWIEGEHRSVAVLVSADGRPAVLGCASQQIGSDQGRIHYGGGVVPIAVTESVDRMARRVIEAIPGLRGWVGIDWIDAGHDDPIVLEVNPRPTTSIVGFLALLQPGMLAEAWLGQIDLPATDPVKALTDRIRSFRNPRVSFTPDGTRSCLRDGAGR